jgi:hypothetical protein
LLTFLVRLFEVPDYSRYVAILCGQHRLRIVCRQVISVKRMQILVRNGKQFAKIPSLHEFPFIRERDSM